MGNCQGSVCNQAVAVHPKILIFIDLTRGVCYITHMQETALSSNQEAISNKGLQGVKSYWLWTPPRKMTVRDKEISDAVVECLRLFARYGRIAGKKETSPHPRAC
jgi:hypothetical protein